MEGKKKTTKRANARDAMEADDDDDVTDDEEEDLDAEIRSLGTLIENGIGKRFDARAYAGRRWWWCDDDDDDDDTVEMMMEDVCFDCTPDGSLGGKTKRAVEKDEERWRRSTRRERFSNRFDRR